jgi:hypothetical protein
LFFHHIQIERKKDLSLLCCILDYVENVCEQLNNSKKKVPVDVLCSILAFVLIVKNSLPSKAPMMLNLMCIQFEKGLIDTYKKYSSGKEIE